MLDRSPGRTAVLDRQPIPPTETEPRLQTVGSELAVAGGTEDSSVTVIENPALSGLTGLLISRSFFDGAQRRLTGVLHLRVDERFTVKEQEEYPLVILAQTRGQGDLYAALGSGKQILPSLSRRPYIICFIPSKRNPGLDPEKSSTLEDYESWYRALSKAGNRAQDLQALYKFLAHTKYPDFRIDKKGQLVLPSDYAMVERAYGLGLFR